jgi:hypothetical protein
MNIFAKGRPETALDRKARAVFERTITPSQTLLASTAVFLCCAYCFAVVLFGWPKGWAREVYALCVFIAPALSFASVRELWRSGRSFRYAVAATLSFGAFALWCASTYFVIHPRAANHSMQRTGASRSAQFLSIAQWRLAPAADAGRWAATAS